MRVKGIKKNKGLGLPPGTLVHVGERKTEQVRISCIDYDENRFDEKQVPRAEQCADFKKTPTVTWINVDGIHEVEVIRKLGNDFGLHSLVLEDILNTSQRPKIEEFEKFIFVVLKMLQFDHKNESVEVEQVSMVIGENFLISFQERAGDVFEQVRERLRTGKGRIRSMRVDYLAYSLVDALVDNYFAIMEKLGEKIEGLEEEVLIQPAEKTVQKIHFVKREMVRLRRSVWPLREVISGLQRNDSGIIQEGTQIYLRDVYDHTIQVMDTIESYRDIVSGLVEVYLSSVSNRMNAVMKVLTIIATIFIPLTFVAGIYGMNFQHMPELEWKWGYPCVILVMGAIFIVMLVYFRSKKWL